jgi:hypothetical protein
MQLSGSWILVHDWICDGSYKGTKMTIGSDGPFADSDGKRGKWVQRAGMITLKYENMETTYAGNLASKSVTGISTNFSGLNGCFYMLEAGVDIRFIDQTLAPARNAARLTST